MVENYSQEDQFYFRWVGVPANQFHRFNGLHIALERGGYKQIVKDFECIRPPRDASTYQDNDRNSRTAGEKIQELSPGEKNGWDNSIVKSIHLDARPRLFRPVDYWARKLRLLLWDWKHHWFNFWDGVDYEFFSPEKESEDNFRPRRLEIPTNSKVWQKKTLASITESPFKRL